MPHGKRWNAYLIDCGVGVGHPEIVDCRAVCRYDSSMIYFWIVHKFACFFKIYSILLILHRCCHLYTVRVKTGRFLPVTNWTNRRCFRGYLQGSSQESSRGIPILSCVLFYVLYKYVSCEARNVDLSCSQSVKCLELLLQFGRNPCWLWCCGCNLILCHLHSTPGKSNAM